MVASQFHSQIRARGAFAAIATGLVAAVLASTLMLSASAGALGSVDSVAVECVDHDGVLVVALSNHGNAPSTFEVSLGSMATRTLRLGPGVSGNVRIGGLDDGEVPLNVRQIKAGSANAATYAGVVIIDCDQPFSALVTTSCLAGNGRFDVDLFNGTEGAVKFDVQVPGLPTRSRAVPADSVGQLTITGRDDGSYAIRVSVGGSIVSETTEDVRCDAAEMSIKIGCLGGSGRVDVDLFNADDAAGPGRTYTVIVGTVSPRVITIAGGDSGRVTVTGRPSGPLLIQVDGTSQGTVHAMRQVSCETLPPTPAPAPPAPGPSRPPVSLPDLDADGVAVATGCIGGNGRVDVVVANRADSGRIVSVEFPGLPIRTRSIAPQSKSLFTFTGRADDLYEVAIGTAQGDDVTRSVVVFCDGASFEERSLKWINRLRSERGVAPVQSRDSLGAAARFWSEQMMATDDLVHDCCPGDRLPADLSTWAELVGRGETGLDELHIAFEESSSHASFLIDGRYDQAGFGFAFDGVGLWVTIYLGATSGLR